eukprot:1159469-Pelagomonas_calceolata.AAC.6
MFDTKVNTTYCSTELHSLPEDAPYCMFLPTAAKHLQKLCLARQGKIRASKSHTSPNFKRSFTSFILADSRPTSCSMRCRHRATWSATCVASSGYFSSNDWNPDTDANTAVMQGRSSGLPSKDCRAPAVARVETCQSRQLLCVIQSVAFRPGGKSGAMLKQMVAACSTDAACRCCAWVKKTLAILAKQFWPVCAAAHMRRANSLHRKSINTFPRNLHKRYITAGACNLQGRSTTAGACSIENPSLQASAAETGSAAGTDPALTLKVISKNSEYLQAATTRFAMIPWSGMEKARCGPLMHNFPIAHTWGGEESL